MQQFLRTYYALWRFRHPTTRDLQAVAEDVSRQDLDWFFDQFVYGTAVVDYAVKSMRVQALDAPDEDDNDARRYESEVLLERREDGIFPQVLRVRFDDGTTEEVTWDGADAWKQFTFEKRARLVEAYLDPENIVWLDINRLNNRRVLNADNTLARKTQFKLTVWAQQLLYLVGSLF
jgi:hypothetical protein